MATMTEHLQSIVVAAVEMQSLPREQLERATSVEELQAIDEALHGMLDFAKEKVEQ